MSASKVKSKQKQISKSRARAIVAKRAVPKSAPKVKKGALPITAETIQGLIEAECLKLKDPLYPGGGTNPPFGPTVDQTSLNKDRFAYFDVLQHEWKRLVFEQLSK